MNIRPAKLDDAVQIAEIYNFYIQNTHQTFETEPLTGDEMRERIAEYSRDYPYVVAEENGKIYGYAYASLFKLRRAYEFSAEVSIYVNNDEKQRGIGSKLYARLFEELQESDTHTIVAGISLPNDASIRFHEKLGFEKIAHFREIGYKLGRWVDVGFWQKMNTFDDEDQI